MNLLLLLLLAGLEHEYWVAVRHKQYIEDWDKYCNSSHHLDDMVMNARLSELALNNFTHQAIALVGPSKVAESLEAQVLCENFPWPDQVETMSWRDTKHKKHIIKIIKNAYLCGETLIFLDDMKPQDIHFAGIINKLISEQKEIDNSPDQLLKQLTILYVFQVKPQSQNQEYETEMQQQSELELTDVVIFEATK